MNWLLVFLGGGLGSVCRYALSRMLPQVQPGFPWATLLANLAGCLLIGLLAHSLAHDSAWRWLLVAGFCGGFTTFSTLSLECVQLWQAQQFATLALYLAASLILGLIAVAAGLMLGRP